MQFLVLAYDLEDANERRLACREDHLQYIQKFIDHGQVILGGAIFDSTSPDTRKMIGSAIVCDFASEEVLNAEWLNNDPYVKNRVWGNIQVQPYAIAPGFKGKKLPE